MTEVEAAARIRSWFDAALAAVDPERAVARHLALNGDALIIAGHRVELHGRIIVIAVGKAAVPMARAAESALGPLVSGGIALTKDGHADGPPLRIVMVREAAHPIPDARGVAATTDILALLGDLTAEDLVIALISGGGSALLEAPVEGVSLDDIAGVTSLLLKAGAPIDHLNAVRIPLSRVKGGGLRRAANAQFATLILSDVLGNDPAVIASGPTVPGAATGAAALALLDQYGLRTRVPASVVAALERQAPPSFDASSGDLLEIVADNRIALEAFAAAARADGQRVRILLRDAQGEAGELARAWVAPIAGERDATLLLGGGEATVTVRGNGEGGRNTEFALAAALELDARGLDNWIVGSLATDGQDANTGVAGAIAARSTVQRARLMGIDVAQALAQNDSLKVFRAAGGVVETGPTGTNLNDIYLAMRLD